jgi:hypothetical protein
MDKTSNIHQIRYLLVLKQEMIMEVIAVFALNILNERIKMNYFVIFYEIL